MDPATAAPASDLTAEQRASVLRQLEYYFCDLSFPFDDFLKSQAEEDGSIAASVLAVGCGPSLHLKRRTLAHKPRGAPPTSADKPVHSRLHSS